MYAEQCFMHAAAAADALAAFGSHVLGINQWAYLHRLSG